MIFVYLLVLLVFVYLLRATLLTPFHLAQARRCAAKTVFPYSPPHISHYLLSACVHFPAQIFLWFLGSGPIGDDDLWYHDMRGNSLFCLSVNLSLSLPYPPNKRHQLYVDHTAKSVLLYRDMLWFCDSLLSKTIPNCDKMHYNNFILFPLLLLFLLFLLLLLLLLLAPAAKQKRR